MENDSNDDVVHNESFYVGSTHRITDPKGNVLAETSYTGELMAVDMHTHPSMHAYMYNAKFWKQHDPSLYGYSPWAIHTDFPALEWGGVRTFFCTVYVLERTMFADVAPLRWLSKLHPKLRRIAGAPMPQLTREYLDTAERMVEETRKVHGDRIGIGRSFAEMKRIHGEGKICMLHAVEGAHHLGGDIGMVDELFARGVCHFIVPHLYPNEAGGCCPLMTEDVHVPLPVGFHAKYQDASGVSEWGRELIEKLLDVGILVDAIHGTREYRRQVIEIVRNHPKKRPAVLSHVTVPNYAKSGLNPLPEDIREIAETGGVVGLMMTYQNHADEGKKSGVACLLEAVEYLIQHGGEDVVAFGSDFDGTFENLPSDIKSPRGYAPLREALLGKYTERQVVKFMNGNAERVLKDGWGK